MAYRNPIEFIFLFCSFIAPSKIRVGICDVDTYGAVYCKRLLLEIVLLCYYSCRCCSYCYLSMTSRKILKTERCKYCFDVNNRTSKLLSRELKADCWSVFYPNACIVWTDQRVWGMFKLHNERGSRSARSFWVWVSPLAAVESHNLFSWPSAPGNSR